MIIENAYQIRRQHPTKRVLNKNGIGHGGINKSNKIIRMICKIYIYRVLAFSIHVD